MAIADSSRREAAFRVTLGFALGMLIIQFLLGMTVNLFVGIPAKHPGSDPPEYFSGTAASVTWAILHGDWWLRLHAVWGLLIVLGAFGTVIQAIVYRGRARITLSAVAFLAALAAGFNGGSFLDYREDFSSMLMAIGFALAVTLYVVLLFRSPRPAPPG